MTSRIRKYPNRFCAGDHTAPTKKKWSCGYRQAAQTYRLAGDALPRVLLRRQVARHQVLAGLLRQISDHLRLRRTGRCVDAGLPLS